MKKILKKLAIGVMAALMVVPTIASSYASVYDGDSIINLSKKGSLTLYKYDYTAISERNVDISNLKNDGKNHRDIESKLSDFTIPDVEFSYIKIADIWQDETVNKVTKLMYNVDPKLLKVLGLSEGKHDTTELNIALNNVLAGNVEKNTNAKNQFERYIEKANKTRMPLTDKNGKTTKNNMDLGLYLIVETKVPANVHSTVNPFFVSIPMTRVEGTEWFYDITIYPKNESDIPTLAKKVREHDYRFGKPKFESTTSFSTGDTLDFISVSKFPKITSEATYISKYDFHDKADKGLVYSNDLEVYFYDNKVDAENNNTEKAIKKFEKGSPYFTISYNNTENTFDFSFTEKGLKEINNAMSEKFVVLSYTMSASKYDTSLFLGDKGNANDVTLTWKRTSDVNFDTLKSRTRVFSYGIDLTKEFTKGSKDFDFSRVSFALYNVKKDYYLTFSDLGNGLFYVHDVRQRKVVDEGLPEGQYLVPNKNGQLNLRGLESGEYDLIEMTTSEHYQLLKKPIRIVIKDKKENIIETKTTHYDKQKIANNSNKDVIETVLNNSSAKVNNQDVAMLEDNSSLNARVPMKVINTPKVEIPFTGSKTVLSLAVIGVICSLGGLMINKKRKTDKVK